MSMKVILLLCIARLFPQFLRARGRGNGTKLRRLCAPGGAVLAVASGLIAALPGPAVASKALSDMCDRAAVVAAQRHRVPLDVMQAITRTETGRPGQGGLAPWPWTVNMEGVGKWFDSRDAARAYVFKHYKRGARSFDVGCFQINFKWHGEAFTSIDEMFDPGANANYAARFLADLYRELGSWKEAAGAYHSRTPHYANRYAKRFDRIRSGLSGGVMVAEAGPAPKPPRRRAPPPPWPQAAIEADRVRPILGRGETSRGSLFPLAAQSGSSFLAFE